jgi:hypothetical protein
VLGLAHRLLSDYRAYGLLTLSDALEQAAASYTKSRDHGDDEGACLPLVPSQTSKELLDKASMSVGE